MNYRHLFHAGNFADVFKHTALALLLRTFHAKETPMCYVETHAGAGRYDLRNVNAQRSGEFRNGIERLWRTKDASATLTPYLDIVHALNPGNDLKSYPGSPLIARRLLREQDRMLLCERHPDEYAFLKMEFANDRQVAVHERDGYEAFKAFLPPKERRGLVLIDPPYEQRDEFECIISSLKTAYARWPTGVYAVWYPIKDRYSVAEFYRALRGSDWRKVLASELLVFPEDTAFRLNGCGLVVINPPWGFERTFSEALSDLKRILIDGDGPGFSLEWLKTETSP